MEKEIKHYNLPLIIYFLLLVLTISFMFFVGFRHREQNSENNFEWLPGGNGLQFNEKSFAYTESLFSDNRPENEGFSIELSIKPAFPEIPRFGVILQIYDKSNNSQITLGQWDHSLVILNSDDYSNQQRKPKIYISMEKNNRIKNIVLISDSRGTKIYIDGKLESFNGNLKMSLPEQRNKTNLIVGNTIESRNPWTGTITYLAIYDRAIIKQKNHDAGEAQLIYSFDESKGFLVQDKSGNENHLLLPEKTFLLKRNILALPNFRELNTAVMREDIVINFFGFIPLGILLFIIMTKIGIKKNAGILLLTALFSLFFSLSIEITQVLIPARSSSMLDLFLNTLGGFTGAVIISRGGARRPPA